VIISFSGHANIDNAIESVKAGANDFIEKPFETKKLIHIIQKNLLELKQRVTINNYRNKISFHSKIDSIGHGKYIENIFKTLNKIKNNSSILIYGPNGIGKNFLANTIHMRLSSNNPDTFINLNENLLNETDLLKLSSLHNYFTIYLNDYENFNQIELLNYLNLVKSKKINASIIFDSKKIDIKDPFVNNVDYKVLLNPLISRKDEIFPLFKHYLNIFSLKKFENRIEIDENIHQLLLKHSWPGNIFEIMNLSENVTSLLTDSNLFVSKVLIEDLMKNSTNNADLYDLNFKEAKDKFEKDYLLQKLKINNFNMTLTAKMLRLDRVSLYRKVKSLNIKID
jgi:two-component system nitrogen regulation response regulator NtrX